MRGCGLRGGEPIAKARGPELKRELATPVDFNVVGAAEARYVGGTTTVMFDRLKHALGWRSSSEPTDLQPTAVFNDALRSAFDKELLTHGFEQVKALKWVRSAKRDIRDLIELYPLKGASIAPRWGFSLDFVPHVAAGRVRWHRTAKSSMLDLVWDPLDFVGLDGWTQSRFVVLAELPRVAQLFAAKVCRAALADVAKAQHVSDLPLLYREWAARPTVRFSIQNYPQAPIGEAFVLKRLGLPGALDCLRGGTSGSDFDDATRQQLLSLLEAESPGA